MLHQEPTPNSAAGPAFRTDNEAVLSALIAAWGQQKASAVFDWDNTSIAGDIGELMFFYQLDHACVQLAPQQLTELLLPLVHRAPSNAALLQLVSLAEASWRKLWPYARSGSLGSMAQSPHHQAWRLALVGLYERLTTVQMPQLLVADSYFLLAQLWAGFNQQEVFEHTLKALTWAKKIGPQAQHWQLLPQADGPQLKHSFAVMAAPREPMRALYRRLDEAGIVPWVISASFEPIVRACAQHFGYQAAAEHIFGLRLKQDEAGRFMPQACDLHPITYRAGKVAALRQYVRGQPVLVAGDALTDYELLVEPEGLAVQLVIDRHSTAAPMQQLYKKGRTMRPHLAALAQQLSSTRCAEPITLLEDVDPSDGQLVCLA